MFRYAADRIPTAIVVGLSGLDLAVYLLVDDPWLIVLWLLIGFAPKACICSWNHHHQHLPTFHSKYLNRAIEVLYGLHTGISTNGWVLHHVLGHHRNYLDQTKDESAWKDGAGNRMGTFRYTMTTAITGYWRAYIVGRRHPKYQREFLSAGMLTMLIVAGLIWYRPFQGIVIFLLPMAIGLIITAWHTFYHHSGLESDDHFQASHNIIDPLYNLLSGNLGYHTAHHIKPGLHWSLLPEYHATIAHRIPPHLFVEPCIPIRWLPKRIRNWGAHRLPNVSNSESQPQAA